MGGAELLAVVQALLPSTGDRQVCKRLMIERK
jgi:hypothetical protein